MIKIILVEDHLVVRNGIKLLLDSQDKFEVIAEANDGRELLALLEEGAKPDIVLADIHMPNLSGLELAAHLSDKSSEIKVVLLTMSHTAEQILQAFATNVRGYLSKNVGYDELLFALTHIANGGRHISEEIAMDLIDALQGNADPYHSQAPLPVDFELSEREREVLQLISEGYTNSEIADRLYLSKRTVEGHRQSLISKAKTKNSAQLVKFAVQHKLVD